MQRFKVKYFVDAIMPHIMVDRAFQRKACWSEKTCREFILSSNLGRAFYPIVVAEVKTGLEASKIVGREYSIKKYEFADGRRKDYISLDGQNRSMAWKKFFENKIHVSGNFIDADNQEVTVRNATYNQLPERLQDALRDNEIIMSVAKGCLYDELHEIFVNINSGEALNAQEIRNAINTPISEFFRTMSERQIFVDGLNNILSWNEKKTSRSLDCEYIAKAYMVTLQTKVSWNPSKNLIDKFYEIGKGKRIENVPEYSQANKNRFINIIINQGKILKDQKNIPQKIWWLCLYVAETILFEKQVAINDYKKLYEIITKIDSELWDESRTQLGRDLQRWKRLGEIPDQKPVPGNYYHQWAVDIKSDSSRNNRKKAFFTQLYKEQKFKDLVEDSLKTA